MSDEYGKTEQNAPDDEARLLEFDADPADDHTVVFREQFEFALDRMATIYKDHRTEKGDSWKAMSPDELRVLLWREIKELTNALATDNEPEELADVLNVGFMLLTRLCELKTPCAGAQ